MTKTSRKPLKNTEKNVSYKKTLFTLVGFMLVLLWLIWGNMTIEVSHLTISNQNIPNEFQNFKIAQISDLHDKNWGQTLIRPLLEEKPDIIVITGDLIDSNKPDIYQAAELIKQIKQIAPIYFVSGNHEAWSGFYSELKDSLLKHDVTILDNNSVTLKINGAEILLLGIEDPAFFPNGTNIEELKALTNGFPGFSILLSHRPELFSTYVSHDISLVLSGHAHGGQFRLPFIGGLIAPDQGFFPAYTSGIHKENNTQMIISRGLGNSIIPIRVNNRPELIIIELSNEN